MYPAPPVTRIRKIPYPQSFMLIGSLLRLSIIVDGKESLDSGYRW
jgi:hypothetical protein